MKVYVGAEKRLFLVPRKLLCSNSIYCDRLLNKNGAEAPEDRIYLGGHESKAFDLLIMWLLQGSLALEKFRTFVYASTARKAHRRGCHVLCGLYRLCDSIQVVKDKQVILRVLRELSWYGNVLRLELRTIHMVLMTVSENLTLHEWVLQMVALDLLDEKGHEYDYYSQLLEGPIAIPGLVKALFQRMRRKKHDEPRRQVTSWDPVLANMNSRVNTSSSLDQS